MKSTAAAILRFAALVGAIGLATLTTTLILSRLAVNFDHDWVESTVVRSMNRITEGRSMYPPPTTEFVGDNYPPFYFHLCATLTRFIGNPLFTARLVSLVATAFVFMALRRISSDTRNAAGLTSPTTPLEKLDRWFPPLLLLAFYAACDQTFDLARVDMTTIALTTWAAVLALKATSLRGAVLAGLLMAAAILTKHNIVLMGAAIGAGLLLHSPRRAIAFGVTALAIPAALFTTLHRATGGWSSYYLYEQLTQNDFGGKARWTRFLVVDLGWHGTLLIGLLAAGFFALWNGPGDRPGFNRRHTLAVALIALGGLAMTLSGRLKVGGFPNNLVPAWTFALFALAWCLPRVRVRLREADATPRKFWSTATSILLLAIVAALGFTYTRIPLHRYLDPGKRTQAVAELQQLIDRHAPDGPVWIPAHSGTLPHADQFAHLCPIGFTIDTPSVPARSMLERDILAKLDRQLWSAIILDDPRDKFISPTLWKALLRNYTEQPWPMNNPNRLTSLTGKFTCPRRIFVRRKSPFRPPAELEPLPTAE